MKTLKKSLFYYLLGVISALLIIGSIHLYSYIFEPYYSYAEWSTILVVALLSGIPFGVAIWVFKNLKTIK
jgi:hypothetical protein